MFKSGEILLSVTFLDIYHNFAFLLHFHPSEFYI